MNISFLDHRRMRQIVALLLFTGTFFCIFPANQFMMYWADNARLVALEYLVLGLFFFLINRERLMFVCMGCCALICFYYLEIHNMHPSVTPLNESAIDSTHHIKTLRQ